MPFTEIETMVLTYKWMHRADRFDVGPSKLYQTNIGGREVKIETRKQIDGITLWVVKMDDTWVLGKDNKYHYEPQPSSRTDAFINNTRWESKEAALQAYLEHETLEEMPQLTVPKNRN